MKLPKLFIIIAILKLKQYLSVNLLLDYHTEYITITNKTSGLSGDFNLELISKDNYLFDSHSNQKVYSNYIFYYLSYNDSNWKETIKTYRNYIIIYCEDLNTFFAKLEDILKYLKNNIRIKQIIIGCDQNFEKNVLNIDNEKITEARINIFITRNKDKINSYYNTSAGKGNIDASIYINYYYAGDVIADKFVLTILFVIFIFICVWIFVIRNAKNNDKFLFVHGYILVIFIFYLCQTLLYTIITFKKKYEIFDEELFSGALYNIFNFFQFFTKLLPALFATMQLNLFEIREHYRIIKNSKVIHILAVNIFFVISFENENENLSEILNGLFYILIIICLFYMFIQFKLCLEEKLIDAIIDDPANVPTVKFKKKLLYIHTMIIISYVIIYYIIIFILRYNFAEYRTIKFIIAFINYTDLCLLCFLVGVYFPKKLPPQYVEQSNLEPDIIDNIPEENDYFENIYAFDLTEEEKYFENYKKDEMSSIVIIENPYNENKIEILMEQDELNEEEEEEEEETDIKEKENSEDINLNKKEDDKKDIVNETTEENSIDKDDKENTKLNIDSINNSKDEKIEIKNVNNEKNDMVDNHNNIEEEEHNTLVVKEEEEMINKIKIDGDILDLHRTKLGYIEVPLDDN